MTSSFVGRTLGKYEITELLGQGGMATVYKGYHREIDRYIAIKVLPPHPGRDPRFVERFRLEARTIAHLQHPHILSLYDYGTQDDILYLAMAFVEGGALTDLLNAGRLLLPRIEELLKQVASALDYAHRQGVIHRDIKPGNILLDGEGRALLADFGIAKMIGTTSTLTGTGGLVGTPAYMAPEQSQADTIDHRADIYSLGVVVYEMLTGRQPYQTVNPLRMIMKHVHDPIPSITRARRDLPPGLEAVMQRVMAKKPDDRYQTTMDFYEAFSQAVHAPALPGLGAPSEITASAAPTDNAPAVPVSTLILSPEPPPLSRNQRLYTFLFTDIEGSTQLWEQQPEAMSVALAYHDTIMSQTIQSYQGKIFKTIGDGICAVFDSADNALQAALAIQRLLFQAATRPEDALLPLAVRMGLYSGMAEERANDYFGQTLNRGSRVMDAAHGGQILLPEATRNLLPAGVELRDLGKHHLRDLSEPEHIFQAISPGFPVNAKPIRSLSPRPNNLPAQLTSFVGRERTVAEIAQQLHQPHTRLLTLLGAGGIGKTRLSIQVGTSLLDEYADGVFFIALAPLNQTDAVVKFLAQILNIQEEPATPLLDSVKAYCQPRQMLLIFDNFEHILDAAPMLNELLTVATRLKILVTSRELLFIYGERAYTVPPLRLPEPDEAVSDLLRSSAVTLFVERIQAFQPEFVLSDSNAPDVVNICRQLDGLPLALELAAARVRDLTLAEIAGQLTQRLALLSKGPRDMPMRQQTMRGAVEWSYHLLSPAEQRTFAHLAIFEGQFYAEAAQAVLDKPDLEGFISKSLIQQADGEVFSMLAVLREYALERLVDFNELTAMRHKHGAYYCQWLETAEEHLNGRDQMIWYSHLSVEQHNVQAALGWFLQQQDMENAGRMVGVLWRYWATQSLLSEGEGWISSVLAHADELSPLTRAKAMHGAGRLALLRHDYVRATELQRTSLALYRSVPYPLGQASVLLSLGETEYVQNNHIQAENYLGESLELFRKLDDQAGVARCLNLMGSVVTQNGDFAKAEPLLRESVMLARQHGSSEGIALALYNLASALRAQAKYLEAEEYYRQSLTLYQGLNLGVGVATMLYNLGFTLQGLGNHPTAMEHFLEALHMLETLEEDGAVAECLIGVAGEFLHLGNREMCIKTLSAAHAALTSLNALGYLHYADQALYDRLYAAVKGDDAQWQAAWAAGQTAPLGQILKAILQEAQPGVPTR